MAKHTKRAAARQFLSGALQRFYLMKRRHFLRSRIRTHYCNPQAIITYFTDARNYMNWVLNLGEPKKNPSAQFRYIFFKLCGAEPLLHLLILM